MSNFLPTKKHLREVLIFCFHCGNRAADAHRLLVDVYGAAAPTDKSCRSWFRRFKDGDFNVEDKERSGRPKKFQDAELGELLDQDPTQLQEELANTVNVTQSAIARRLKALGLIQKQGNWVPLELSTIDVEKRYLACQQLLERYNRKGFLHQIVTGDEKWIHYNNHKSRKINGKQDEQLSSELKPDIFGAKVLLCIWWDQKGVVYFCTMNYWNLMKLSMVNGIGCN